MRHHPIHDHRSAEILPLIGAAHAAAANGSDDEDAPFAHVVATAADLREVLAQHGDRYSPILGTLREQPWKELLTSREIMDSLQAQGLDWSERTLRLYLAEMTGVGLIDRHGRRGYKLTEAGAAIARELTVARRLGSILSKMDETMCSLTFTLSGDEARDGETGRSRDGNTAPTGLVSINAYVIPLALVPMLVEQVEAVYRAGLAVGARVLLVEAGGDILGRAVPAGHIGLGTPCSNSLASLLLRRGIPSQPVFGGLLHIAGGLPQHFLEMIRYDATTLSPNEVFIRANLTSVSRAAKTGTGDITASYREVPVAALPALKQVQKDCASADFPGILLVGQPGRPVLNIPVHEGRVGVVLATGLNPVAGLWEHDPAHPTGDGVAAMRHDYSRPMVGPADYTQLIPFHALRARLLSGLAPDS